ncbi:hypothetical protein ACFPJ4_04160 [Lysinimonas soli]|uniref:DinB family protein n=1 Tax=Lysinimonas soli TaxID=1074233 RepID=A0ABW0NN31_9MICO
MDLSTWLVDELDDTVLRLSTQVLEIVPAEVRRERFPGGNSIDWAVFHVARHAALALRVAGHDPAMSDSLLAGLDPSVTAPASGLHEVQQPFLEFIETPLLEAYALSVLDEVRAYLSHLDEATLEVAPDVAGGLRSAGIDEGEFGWLYSMWSASRGFLVRWPMIGHVTNHVGEMIATRNQLGLSPFR